MWVLGIIRRRPGLAVRCFTLWVFSLALRWLSFLTDTITNKPVVQVRTPKLRELKQLSHDVTARQWHAKFTLLQRSLPSTLNSRQLINRKKLDRKTPGCVAKNSHLLRNKAKQNQTKILAGPRKKRQEDKKIQVRSQLYRKFETSLGLVRPVSKQNKRHC